MNGQLVNAITWLGSGTSCHVLICGAQLIGEKFLSPGDLMILFGATPIDGIGCAKTNLHESHMGEAIESVAEGTQQLANGVPKDNVRNVSTGVPQIRWIADDCFGQFHPSLHGRLAHRLQDSGQALGPS
jgi:hypothetical protein